MDYHPALLSGFFIKKPKGHFGEFNAKGFEMGKYRKLQVTPLMSFCLPLTASIIIAQYGYDYISTHIWLIAAIMAWGFTTSCYVLTEFDHHSDLFSKKITRLINCQCLSLYVCIFAIGGYLTSHEIDKQNAPAKVESYQSLSSIDRTILKAQSFKKHLEHQLQSYSIDQQDFAIISAMAMGDKASLDKNTKEIFSISGTSHILAVSGLHIGIIFQLIILLLGGKRRSKLTIAVSLTAVWIYVVFIGLPPSAVRAATMLSIYSFGLLSMRPDPTLNTLAFAYIIMIFVNPLHIFEVSFQMSFLAVGSIIMFYPLFFGLLESHNNFIRGVYSLFCVSLAAQLGTLPIIVYYFGRVSCYSLLVSFVAIPAATLILYLCAFLLIFSVFAHISGLAFAFTWLADVTVQMLGFITHVTHAVFKFTSMLPGASIEDIHLSLLQLILIYIAILCFFLAFTKWNNIRNKEVKIHLFSGLPF